MQYRSSRYGGRALHIGGDTDLIWLTVKCEGEVYFLLNDLARFGKVNKASLCPIAGVGVEQDGVVSAKPLWPAVQNIFDTIGNIRPDFTETFSSCAASLQERLTIAGFEVSVDKQQFVELQTALSTVPAADGRTHRLVSVSEVQKQCEQGKLDTTVIVPFQAKAALDMARAFRLTGATMGGIQPQPDDPTWAIQATLPAPVA